MANRTRKAGSPSRHIWYLIGGLLLLVIIIFAKNSLPQSSVSVIPSASPTLSARTFTASSVMGGFTIDVPEGFMVQEKSVSVILKKNNEEIIISKSTTNFLNLEDYLIDLNYKNKIEPIESKKLMIDVYPTVKEIIQFNSGEKQKIYVIFVNGNVFDLFTNFPNLYSDLDQIAQSFHIPKN